MSKFSEEAMIVSQQKISEELKFTTLEVQLLKEENENLRVEYGKLQTENEELKKWKKTQSVKVKNQTISRKNKSVQMWKTKYKSLSKPKDASSSKSDVVSGITESSKSNLIGEKRKLKHRISNLKYRKRCRKEKLSIEQTVPLSEFYEQKVSELTAKLKQSTEIIKNLENEIGQLQDTISNLENSCGTSKVIPTKEGSSFSVAIRKVIYKCITCQVPVDRTTEIIEYVISQLTNHQLEELPSRTSICRIVREMGILSDLQTAEALCTSKNSTLGWDSTPIDGVHINETHVCTEKGVFTLALSELAGGTTADYSSSIMQVLEQVVNSYSEYVGLDKKYIQKTLCENITSTIGDRVPVNHCVVTKLAEAFGQELIELNCNIHPIDGLAGSCRKVLKSLNEVQGSTFGREAPAVNFVMAMSKMRYKAGTGDPASFKLHLKQNKIPCKTFPRYVGNRFNILFELCAVFYYHRSTLTEYLERYCPVTNGLRSALLKDIKNPLILEHLQAVGIYGKVLTDPWMKLVYTTDQVDSSDVSRHHFSIVGPLKTCIAGLECLQEKGSFCWSHDLFGQDLAGGDLLTGNWH